MATQTLANFDALLKNVYRGPIVELLNQETYLIQWVQSKDAQNLGNFSGRQVIFPIHTSRNRGRGGTTDGGALVTAGRQGSLDAIVSIQYFDGAIELSDQVIKQTKDNEGAFVSAMDYEMNMAATDLKKDACRIGYGTGDGVLANIASGATSATQAVDSGQYIAVGDTVDVLTKATGAVKGSGLTVNSVTYTGTAGTATQANANVVLSGSVTTTTADAIYIAGDRNLETDGLRNIVSTGRILHQVNSSTNPIWDSNVLDATQTNANEDLFMRLAQTIRQRSGKTPDAFLTTLGVQRRLANTYASQKRWNDDRATTLDGGYEVINISAGGKATPVISDVDAPTGTAFALNNSSFGWTQIGPPDWLAEPGGGAIHWELKDSATAGSKLRAWQAWIVWDAAMYCKAPHQNGKIINLNDEVPVARI